MKALIIERVLDVSLQPSSLLAEDALHPALASNRRLPVIRQSCFRQFNAQSGGAANVMGLVTIRKVDFVSMCVAPVRHTNDNLERMWFSNVSRGFEVFTLRVKGENLARTVRSHCFNFYGRVSGHGTRPLVFVIQKESKARRYIGFKDGDFNKAVAEVHEEAIVWSAFDVPTVTRGFARRMRMAVAFAVNVPNHVVEAKSHQSHASSPR